LEVHAKGKPIGPDVNLELIARRTPGFTGADLANVLNEAALLTARGDLTIIGAEQLDEAIDRVIAGPQKRTRMMNEHDKRVTAYHESGHALVAAAMNDTDPVTKVTILPRGRALGYTMVMPQEDRYSQTRNQLLDNLAYAMGGRIAEEIVFGDPSTGASNDIQQATEIARNMVTEYGMSAKVGSVRLAGKSGEMFLGRDMGHGRDYSEQVASVVDAEVRTLLDNAMTEAVAALMANRKLLDTLAEELLEKETLGEDALAKIFEKVKRIPARDEWVSGAWSQTETRGAKRPAVKGTVAAKKPAAKKPAAKKPAAKKPAAKKPAAKKPAAKKPATKTPAPKNPTAKRPVAKKPVAPKSEPAGVDSPPPTTDAE